MTSEEIDKLQSFIDDNLFADVSTEVYNELMTDAETLDMADFNKKWDKFLRANSQGWKTERKDTRPLNERVSEAFKDDLNPSDNWIEENFPDVPVESVKAELAKLQNANKVSKEEEQKAKEYQKERQLLADRQKAVDNYQHSYFGMDKDNLLNIGLNKLADLVISDDTKRAIVEDPNNTSRIVGNAAVDIGGTALDFTPGAGKAAKAVSYLAGPTLRTGRDVAEGKSWTDIAKNAAIDFGGNVVLGEGMKGIPGLSDMKTLRNVEEKIPTNDWAVQAARANKYTERAAEIPKFKNYAEAQEWIMKQPKSDRAIYQKALDESYGGVGNAKLEDVQKTLIDRNKQEMRKSARAKEWVKEHPVKAGVGTGVSAGTIGIERSATKKLKSTPPKYTKPSEVKDVKTHDDALNYIIENTKSQWEAGFKPNPVKGDIIYEAYKKWESER